MTGGRCKWRHTEKILGEQDENTPACIVITINHDVMQNVGGGEGGGVRFMSESEHKVVTADRTVCLQEAFKCIGIEKQLR